MDLRKQPWQGCCVGFLFTSMFWLGAPTLARAQAVKPDLGPPPGATLIFAAGQSRPEPEADTGSSPHGTALKGLAKGFEFAAPPDKAPDRYPIDLPTALRLAGASNLQIALAAERVNEARARLAGAQAAWLPSLQVGAGYNSHDGQIQDTRGQVIETRRSSVFVGGGPVLGGSFPITGGAGGPGRLAVDFSITDGLFAPLVQRQSVRAADAALTATFNDTLLQVASAYLDLARAQGQVAVATAAAANAEELVRLIDGRIKAGKAPPADGLRVEAEAALRRREVLEAEEAVHVTSAELARLLRLDPGVVLFPIEEQVVPLAMVDESIPLGALAAQALAARPELEVQQALTQAAQDRARQEKWRPFIPNVHLGLSAGGYGGGTGTFIGNFSDRADFDALLVWQLRNLGLGNRALQRERGSQSQQAQLQAAQVRDLVAAEVAAAHAQVAYRHKQIEAARARVKAADQAVPLNFKGVLNDVLRAIEAQQAIQTLAAAQAEYLTTVTAYNQAQFLLLRAIGRPLDAVAEREQ